MIRRSYYTPVYYSGAPAAVNPPYGQAPSGVYPPSVPSSPYPTTYSYPSASYSAYPPATNPTYRTPVTYPAYPPVTNQTYPPVTAPAYPPVTTSAYPPATTPAYPMSYQHYKPTVSSSYQSYYGSYQSPYYGYSSQRTYTRGWSSGFDPFQDYNSSTISDTGRGSANRANQPGYPIPAVPSAIADTNIRDGTHPAEGQVSGGLATDVKEIRASSVYEKIFNEHLKSNSLWEDPDFPASDRSLYYKNPPGIRSIEWKRPHEICSCPKFAKGASRNDIHQGKLGDCWVLAAVADLTTNEKLFQKVVPQEQSFDKGRYAGVFRFVFWQYGRWVEVLVDDRLPTHNGKLVYMTSEERNEFWSSLLEKAYAKLYGSYEALVGGLMSESLEDFTGGISRKIEIGAGKTPSNLGQILLKATSVGALMGCSIDCTNQYTRENQLRNGLIVGHAYSIVDVKKVKTSSQREVQLLRIRNPWGDEHEWNGAWSDESREWSSVPEDERKRLNVQSNDGEFWMSLEDFSREFQTLEICYLGPDSVCDIDHLYQKAWQGTLIEGSWKRKVNAGGCRNFPETFWTNPQYKIHIPAADADEHADGLGTIIVGLMQCNRRKLRKDGKDNFSIGYVIFRLKDPNCGTLGREFFSRNESVAKSPAYIDAREIADVHRLPPGDYVIVPTTFEQNLEGDFIVRVFSERKDHGVKELDDDHTSSVISSSSDRISTDEVDPKESEFENEFEKVVGSKHGAMNARQLQSILNARFAKEMGIKEFQMDLCRSLLALHDLDISGNLDFEEFKKLNKDFFLIRKCFNSCDKDHHGFINSYEMRTLLHTIAAKSESLKGLRISNSTFNAIVMRYSDENGKVFFDDFLSCTSKLKTLFGTFQAKDIHSTGIGEFHVDEFIQLSIYS